MLEKYTENFASLTTEEAAHVAHHLCGHYPSFSEILADTCQDEISGAQLYDLVSLRLSDTRAPLPPLDQADVVMTMADDATAIGVVCLEKLIGRPIVRQAPERKTKPQRGPRKTSTATRDDPRVIATVAPNPKKPGTASYDRYALYQVGMTITDFLAAGGRMADVRWDEERGFITLGAA